MLTSFNIEALKLSVRGVTIVASSGDYGVNYKDQCGYFPLFPASSPYVVAVGATMGVENGIGALEVACQLTPEKVLNTLCVVDIVFIYLLSMDS